MKATNSILTPARGKRETRQEPYGNGQDGRAQVRIEPPRMVTAEFTILGTAPYVQCRFPEKAMREIEAKQKAGSLAGKGKKREPKDFDAMYESAQHKTSAGWVGIPATAFRNAMISACRLCGFKMTIGKLSVFVEPDGFDALDGTPLVRVVGKPEKHVMPGRNDNGSVDLRIRAMWREWSAKVRVRFDADQFTVTDVGNLLMRAGAQVGIGEGRPDSRDSNGMGWGLFALREGAA